jgi:LemA protein
MLMWIILGVVVGLALWALAIYNNLVRKRTMTQEGWSGIEAQLKRRADLIPNLVETVKGYATHERATFEEVTKLRGMAAAQEGAGNVAARAETERQITAMIGRLFAVAEAYPELKANQNFQQLQTDLGEVEDQIQLARRYYNGTVRDYNILVQQAPSNIIAGSIGFKVAEFFQIEDAADRVVPKVSFS